VSETPKTTAPQARVFVAPVFEPVERSGARDDAAATGSPSAPVTAVIFGDVQCPYTARAVTTLLALQGQYGRDRVRLVWRHLPLAFHRRARAAAEAVEATNMLAGGERAWSMLQAILAPGADLRDDGLVGLAVNAGAPRSTFAWLVGEGGAETTSKIDEDVAQARELGITSVPYVLLNGELLAGAQPASVYAELIETLLR
jgi:protein-disulfide isomerase